MVQKQREKNKSSSLDSVSDGLSKSNSLKSSDSTISKLYKAVTKEGEVGSAIIAGLVSSFIGLTVAGLLPTAIIPMLLGFVASGGLLGVLLPEDVYSVLGGVTISSFLTFLVFVNIPILGLGLISTLIFTLIATGATVAAHQYSSEESF